MIKRLTLSRHLDNSFVKIINLKKNDKDNYFQHPASMRQPG
jgi:hypothetical protein